MAPLRLKRWRRPGTPIGVLSGDQCQRWRAILGVYRILPERPQDDDRGVLARGFMPLISGPFGQTFPTPVTVGRYGPGLLAVWLGHADR